MFMISNAAPYDYYKLAQQWPPTFCSTNVCKPGYEHEKTFKIHGLWPANNTGPQPRACDGATSLPSKVSMIFEYL